MEKEKNFFLLVWMRAAIFFLANIQSGRREKWEKNLPKVFFHFFPSATLSPRNFSKNAKEMRSKIWPHYKIIWSIMRAGEGGSCGKKSALSSNVQIIFWNENTSHTTHFWHKNFHQRRLLLGATKITLRGFKMTMTPLGQPLSRCLGTLFLGLVVKEVLHFLHEKKLLV